MRFLARYLGDVTRFFLWTDRKYYEWVMRDHRYPRA